MKKELTEADIINWWMGPYFGVTIEKAFEDNPWTDARDFYRRYQCTQEQHDEWYEWAINVISKYYRCGKKAARMKFVWDYLNLAPSIIP